MSVIATIEQLDAIHGRPTAGEILAARSHDRAWPARAAQSLW